MTVKPRFLILENHEGFTLYDVFQYRMRPLSNDEKIDLEDRYGERHRGKLQRMMDEDRQDILRRYFSE